MIPTLKGAVARAIGRLDPLSPPHIRARLDRHRLGGKTQVEEIRAAAAIRPLRRGEDEEIAQTVPLGWAVAVYVEDAA